jgi:ABC-type nickel/cobalt efflux system permease component RcnA
LHADGIPHHHDHHELPESQNVTLKSLAWLGVSGGMVPCPEALGILLASIYFNRILFGLTLVISFSLGLAGVLIALGLIVVWTKKYIGGDGVNPNYVRVMTLTSAAIIIFMGGYITYKAYEGWMLMNL